MLQRSLKPRTMLDLKRRYSVAMVLSLLLSMVLSSALCFVDVGCAKRLANNVPDVGIAPGAEERPDARRTPEKRKSPESGATTTCGDGLCAGAETCSTCASDCGTCIPGDSCLPPGSTSSGRVFRVGPARRYTTLDAVQNRLGPGDRVEVDGNATYPSIDLTVAGAANAPIFVVGVPVKGKMPKLSGGDNTIHFEGSHHVVFQGFEITGGRQRCVFHEADDITLCQSVIHDCPRHGILGADYGSGSLLLDRIEVHHSGGTPAHENLKHAVYVATDPEAFPKSVFRIQNSYLHDNNGGNAIKSRALRTEVYYNWIEASAAMTYAIELIGFEEFKQPRQDSDVVGNVLLASGGYVLRIGGDGTGASKGRVRFDNNTVIVAGSAWDIYQPIVRFYDQLDAFEASNNVFYKLGGGPVRLTRNDAEWVGGTMKVAGSNNWLPTDSTEVPPGMKATITGAAPGFSASSDLTTLDLTVTNDAPIRQAGVALTNGPAGFEIADPLLVPAVQPPVVRPTSFASMIRTGRAAEAKPTLGAHAADAASKSGPAGLRHTLK